MPVARAASADPVQSLLVATDFSDTAAVAVDFASELALAHRAQLILAHVMSVQPSAMGVPGPIVLPPDFSGRLRDVTRSKLDALAASLRSRGLEVGIELAAGMPGLSLTELAAEKRVDAIVLGTRGLSGFKHLLLGSTAEQVVRHAACPVLTLHPSDRGAPGTLRTLVVPSELSQVPEAALEAVMRLFPRRAAPARLLLVYSDHLPAYLQPLLEDLGIDRVGFEEIADNLRERLCPTAERLQKAGFEVETVVREGDPATVISELAAAEGADLIAMETHGRSGLAHLVLGSTAERVVQHARCPVLTVQREAAGAEEAGEAKEAGKAEKVARRV